MHHMSELLNVDRTNYENPRCPYCNSSTKKNGIIKRVHGIVQRYLCKSCGRTFQEIIKERVRGDHTI